MSKLKKMLVAMPVIVITFLLLTGIAYGETNRSGVITADSVNVREKASTSADIVCKLAKDTKVTILDQDADWYKVKYTEYTGWVFGEYINVKGTVIGTGVVNGSNVNVRSNPDISNDIITKLDKGTKINIYEYSDNWARILVDDNTIGWINLDYVTVTKEKASRSLTSSVRPPVDTDVQDKQEEEKAVDKTDATEVDEDSANSEEGDLRQQVVAYAKKFLGVRYKYGGTTSKGFDCSGFVQYVYKHFGISLERTAADQGSNGTKIDKDDLKPGDLVFFDTNGGHNAIEHAGIYIGDGKFIHASSGKSNRCVTISTMTEGFYYKSYMRSRRYIDD